MKPPRKYFAVLAAALALTLSSGCTLFGLQTSERVLTVAIYGGAFGEALTKSVIEPFERKYDVRVQTEVGVSTTTLGKLRQERRDPQIDVAWLDGGVSEQAEAQQLVEAIPPESITNLADLHSQAKYRNQGRLFALGTGYYALGLVYNTERLDKPPTSWEDLWREEYADKVTVPSPANAMGVPFLTAVNDLAGGGPKSVGPGLEKLRTLQVASYFDTAGNGENLLGSNEVDIGAVYASSAFALADRGEPIAYAVPREGALAGDIRAHLVKDSSNRDLALKLIDFAVSKQAQEGMAKAIYVAPVNKRSEITGETRARMPYGEHGSLTDLEIPDWFFINANRAKWTNQFNRRVVR